MMNKLCAAIAVVTTALGLLLALPAQSAPRADAVRIGAILPLSGATADYGMAIQNSILLAREDRPELFEKLSLHVEDALYDPKLAVSAFKKLVHQDAVDLVYVWGVAFCKVLAPIAEQQHVPLVAQCIDRESSRGKKHVVRFMNSADDYAAATVAYIRRRGWKRIGILLTNNAYLEEMHDALLRAAAGGNERFQIVERLEASENDFNSVVLESKRADYDALGVLLAPGQIATFYRQAAALEAELPTFGTNLFASKSEVELARGAMDGAVFAINDVHTDFHKRYLARFGNDSQIAFGALAYEFVLTIGELAAQSPAKPGGDHLLRLLNTLPQRPGRAAGPYLPLMTPEDGRHFRFPVTMQVIRGSELVSVDDGSQQLRN